MSKYSWMSFLKATALHWMKCNKKSYSQLSDYNFFLLDYKSAYDIMNYKFITEGIKWINTIT